MDRDFMETVRQHIRTEEERELERAKTEERRDARRQEVDTLVAKRIEAVEVDLRSLATLVNVAKGFGLSVKIAAGVMGALIAVFIWIMSDRDADLKSIHNDIKAVNAILVSHSQQIESSLVLLRTTVETQQKDMARLEQHIEKDSDSFIGIEKRLPKGR